MSAAPSSTPVKTPADLPLSALIARIWREYLSDNKAALLTGMACAALAACERRRAFHLVDGGAATKRYPDVLGRVKGATAGSSTTTS